MKNLQGQDRNIIGIGLLCVIGLFLFGRWTVNRPPVRVAIAPRPTAVPKIVPAPTPLPTSTPIPPGPLRIATRKSQEGEGPSELPSPARVLVPVIKTHPDDTITSEQWHMKRCLWMSPSKRRWELYKGDNPPILWYPQSFSSTSSRKHVNTGFIYAPIGRWKFDIQLDVIVKNQSHYSEWRRSAAQTVEAKVDMATLNCNALPAVKPSGLRPVEQNSNQQIIGLQYNTDASSNTWHDLPRPGQAGFPLFVVKQTGVTFRVARLIPQQPLPHGSSPSNMFPVMWRTPSYNSDGPEEITVGFESSGLKVISAQHKNIFLTYVFVMPPMAK